MENVGRQTWRASLLLAEYVHTNIGDFRGRNILELGAGAGIPRNGVASIFSQMLQLKLLDRTPYFLYLVNYTRCHVLSVHSNKFRPGLIHT